MSRQHLGLTTQFPSKGMDWPAKVHLLAKWIAVSWNQTGIACVAIEVHDLNHGAYNLVVVNKMAIIGLEKDGWSKIVSPIGKLSSDGYASNLAKLVTRSSGKRRNVHRHRKIKKTWQKSILIIFCWRCNILKVRKVYLLFKWHNYRNS